MPKAIKKSKHSEGKAGNSSADVLQDIDEYLGSPHDDGHDQEVEILEELEAAAAAAEAETAQAVLNIPKPVSPITEHLPLIPTKSGQALVTKAQTEQGCSARAKPRDVLQQGKNKLTAEASKSLKLLRNIKKEAVSPPPVPAVSTAKPAVAKPPAKPPIAKAAVVKPLAVSSPAQVARSTGKTRPVESMPVLVGPAPAPAATIPNVWPPVGAFNKTSNVQNGRSIGAVTTSQPQTGVSTSQTQTGSSSSTNFSRSGAAISSRGWCHGDKKCTVKCLQLATPTWSQRLADLAEHLQEPRHQSADPVVLGMPMNQFILLKASLFASLDIMQTAYQANKGEIKPHEVGSFHHVKASEQGLFKFVSSRDMANQTNLEPIQEESADEEDHAEIGDFNATEPTVPQNGVGDFNALPEPSYYNPPAEPVAGPSNFQPAAGVSSTNRDPRPFQSTWSSRGFYNKRGSVTRGKARVEPYKAKSHRVHHGPSPAHLPLPTPPSAGHTTPKPRFSVATPRPQPSAAPRRPIGHFAVSKDAGRTDYERHLLQQLKQTQAKLHGYKKRGGKRH